MESNYFGKRTSQGPEPPDQLSFIYPFGAWTQLLITKKSDAVRGQEFRIRE